jgi:hypothetical protein
VSVASPAPVGAVSLAAHLVAVDAPVALSVDSAMILAISSVDAGRVTLFRDPECLKRVGLRGIARLASVGDRSALPVGGARRQRVSLRLVALRAL